MSKAFRASLSAAIAESTSSRLAITACSAPRSGIARSDSAGMTTSASPASRRGSAASWGCSTSPAGPRRRLRDLGHAVGPLWAPGGEEEADEVTVSRFREATLGSGSARLTGAASAQQRTFYDAGGKVVGRSSTDSSGTTTNYDARGKVISRETTAGNTTTIYDAGGRNISRFTTNH
jgi:YD repeat-containing protein